MKGQIIVMKKLSIKKAFKFFLLSFLVIFVAAEGAFLYASYHFDGRVLPSIFFAYTDLSYLPQKEALSFIEKTISDFREKPVSLLYNGKLYSFLLDDLGITLFSPEQIVSSLPVFDSSFDPSIFFDFSPKYIPLVAQINTRILKQSLLDVFPILNSQASNAEFIFSENGKLSLKPEIYGVEFDLDTLARKLETSINFLQNTPITFDTKLIPPRISASDLAPYLTTLFLRLSQTLTIQTVDTSFSLPLQDILDSVRFSYTETFPLFGTQIPVDLGSHFETLPVSISFQPVIAFDKAVFSEYLQKNIVLSFDIEPQDVKIIQDDAGIIQFEGSGRDGRKIELNDLISSIEYAVNHDISRVELPYSSIPSKILASEKLQSLGIRELVATGYSDFSGSPQNRMHNIRVAMSQFNGLLVPPTTPEKPSIFSFDEHLGEVNGETGYKKELVIREGNTIPEYGGGICQVSSTLFRAAFFGGFPIIKRQAHSYAVSYYARPLGYGLDATVYPPYVDLQFENDTGHYLLIQAYTDGNEAYFKFYGTKDNRKVIFDGPYISNRVAPPQDIIIYTTDLPVNEKKKIDSAHEGFQATWNRTVIKEGLEGVLEPFVSRYQAWPNKYLVGIEKTEEGTGDVFDGG